MSERPILFSSAMVRAILAGTKTQTRRIVKPQPIPDEGVGGPWVWMQPKKRGDAVCGFDSEAAWREAMRAYSPYGVPGDRLWVRETWTVCDVEGSRAYIARAERMPAGKTLADTDGGLDEVGDLTPEQARWAEAHIDHERWRPSIHMPRWASRLTLEVTEVRIERLQAITVPDIQAEGVLPADYPDGTYVAEFGWETREWARLWDSINGKRAPWDSNPWTWAISFRRVDA